jgi:hypothetical protein
MHAGKTHFLLATDHLLGQVEQRPERRLRRDRLPRPVACGGWGRQA